MSLQRYAGLKVDERAVCHYMTGFMDGGFTR